MAKIITFFNHKGGVGKTTLAYNVAWGLSSAGKRVLMLDADAQCNLTEVVVNHDEEILERFETKDNIHEFFLQYIRPKPGQQLIDAGFFPRRENLALLVGSLSLAELESPMALSVARVSGMEDIPDNIYSALQSLGTGFDCVVVDLSPALSALNQMLIMLSDYFIIPVSPSIFSRQALRNLGEIFRRWNGELGSSKIFRKRLKELPVLLGIVCQNYRPYAREGQEETRSARRFSDELDKLNAQAIELASGLSGFKMALSRPEFTQVFTDSAPYRIANIPDYNQLALVTDLEKVPVNGLDSKILNKHGLNTEYYRDKLEGFKGECNKIVNGILKLV